MAAQPAGVPRAVWRPRSARLRWARVRARDAGRLHALATDAHVRRYLLDGEVVDRAWAATEIRSSDALFDRTGAGLWLLRERADPQGAPIGFAGFRVYEDMGPEPQLLYAFLARAGGRGLATEAGTVLVRGALDRLGWPRVVSAVDEPNRASRRVLEKLGFRPTGHVPGAFGRIVLLERGR